MKKVTIGHDSEFGLIRNGVITSALSNLYPFESPDGRGFPDNMNAEIAINPVTTLKDFHSKTEGLLSIVKGQGFDLLMDPTIKYPDEALQHPLAYISGCNPDLSAYSQLENEAPDFTKMDATRSCGAHIHVGDEGVDPYRLAQWMDAYVALPLLLKEKPSTRRSLYGGAGCLRIKPYGMEYRTLSNVWLDSEELRAFVWENTHKAVEAARAKPFDTVDDWWNVPEAIDTHNLKLATDMINHLEPIGVRAC